VAVKFGIPAKLLNNKSKSQLCEKIYACSGTSLPLPPMNKTRVQGYDYYVASNSPLTARDFIKLFGATKKTSLGALASKVGINNVSGVNRESIKSMIIQELESRGVPEPLKIKVPGLKAKETVTPVTDTLNHMNEPPVNNAPRNNGTRNNGTRNNGNATKKLNGASNQLEFNVNRKTGTENVNVVHGNGTRNNVNTFALKKPTNKVFKVPSANNNAQKKGPLNLGTPPQALRVFRKGANKPGETMSEIEKRLGISGTKTTIKLRGGTTTSGGLFKNLKLFEPPQGSKKFDAYENLLREIPMNIQPMQVPVFQKAAQNILNAPTNVDPMVFLPKKNTLVVNNLKNKIAKAEYESKRVIEASGKNSPVAQQAVAKVNELKQKLNEVKVVAPQVSDAQLRLNTMKLNQEYRNKLKKIQENANRAQKVLQVQLNSAKKNSNAVAIAKIQAQTERNKRNKEIQVEKERIRYEDRKAAAERQHQRLKKFGKRGKSFFSSTFNSARNLFRTKPINWLQDPSLSAASRARVKELIRRGVSIPISVRSESALKNFYELEMESNTALLRRERQSAEEETNNRPQPRTNNRPGPPAPSVAMGIPVPHEQPASTIAMGIPASQKPNGSGSVIGHPNVTVIMLKNEGNQEKEDTVQKRIEEIEKMNLSSLNKVIKNAKNEERVLLLARRRYEKLYLRNSEDKAKLSNHSISNKFVRGDISFTQALKNITSMPSKNQTNEFVKNLNKTRRLAQFINSRDVSNDFKSNLKKKYLANSNKSFETLRNQILSNIQSRKNQKNVKSLQNLESFVNEHLKNNATARAILEEYQSGGSGLTFNVAKRRLVNLKRAKRFNEKNALIKKQLLNRIKKTFNEDELNKIVQNEAGTKLNPNTNIMNAVVARKEELEELKYIKDIHKRYVNFRNKSRLINSTETTQIEKNLSRKIQEFNKVNLTNLERTKKQKNAHLNAIKKFINLKVGKYTNINNLEENFKNEKNNNVRRAVSERLRVLQALRNKKKREFDDLTNEFNEFIRKHGLNKNVILTLLNSSKPISQQIEQLKGKIEAYYNKKFRTFEENNILKELEKIGVKTDTYKKILFTTHPDREINEFKKKIREALFKYVTNENIKQKIETLIKDRNSKAKPNNGSTKPSEPKNPKPNNGSTKPSEPKNPKPNNGSTKPSEPSNTWLNEFVIKHGLNKNVVIKYIKKDVPILNQINTLKAGLDEYYSKEAEQILKGIDEKTKNLTLLQKLQRLGINTSSYAKFRLTSHPNRELNEFKKIIRTAKFKIIEGFMTEIKELIEKSKTTKPNEPKNPKPNEPISSKKGIEPSNPNNGSTKPNEPNNSTKAKAATKIQKIVRGRRARKKVKLISSILNPGSKTMSIKEIKRIANENPNNENVQTLLARREAIAEINRVLSKTTPVIQSSIKSSLTLNKKSVRNIGINTPAFNDLNNNQKRTILESVLSINKLPDNFQTKLKNALSKLKPPSKSTGNSGTQVNVLKTLTNNQIQKYLNNYENYMYDPSKSLENIKKNNKSIIEQLRKNGQTYYNTQVDRVGEFPNERQQISLKNFGGNRGTFKRFQNKLYELFPPKAPPKPPPPPPRKKQAQKKNPEPEQKKQVPEKTEEEELHERITNLNTILKENSSLNTLRGFFGNSNMNTYIKKLKNIKNKYGPTGNEFNLYNHLRASIPPKVDDIIKQIKKEKERIAKNEEERRKAQALLNEQARRKKEKNEEERRKAQALLNEQARVKKEKNEENKRAQARRNEQARLNAERVKRKALINQLEKNIPGIFENRFQTFKNEYGALHGPLKRLFENKTKHITSVSSKEKALKNALKNLKINPDQVLNLINRTKTNVKIKPTATISRELTNKFMNKVIREMAPKNITNSEVTNIKKKLKKSRK
jgi:hypothetical protein